jgi:PAS domain S-box-containing protein
VPVLARPDNGAKSSSAAQSPPGAPLPPVLDGLTTHVCVLDETGHIVAVNRAWREFAVANGAAPGEDCEGSDYLAVCEQASHSGLPGQTHATAFLQQLRRVLAGEQRSLVFEYPCDGPRVQRWFVAHVSRLPGAGPVRLVVAHDDITNLKEAQETLRAREAQLLDLAASIPGALFRLELSPQGPMRFTYLSPGIQTLYGCTPVEACADPKLLHQAVVAQDLDDYTRSIEAAIASHGAWEHEFRIHGPDGQARWVHARAQPTRVSAQTVVWTGLLTDITQRMRTETALRASEETYRTLFETVAQGVVYQDSHGPHHLGQPGGAAHPGADAGATAGPRIPWIRAGTPCTRTAALPRRRAPGHGGAAHRPAREGRGDGRARARARPVWILVSAMPLVKQGAVQGFTPVLRTSASVCCSAANCSARPTPMI